MSNEEMVVRPRMATLSPGQIDAMHQASLTILSETGLNVHSQVFRDLLEGAGAKVENDLRVRIPGGLVDKAIETAPSCINLHDRNGNKAMALEGTNCYFGSGSDLQYTVDYPDQQRRMSVLKDVEQSARICDKLENIDFVMSYATPNEIKDSPWELEQFRTLLDHTAKPILMTLYSGQENFEKMHEMACESCGGQETFDHAPNYMMYGQFVSPLQHDSDALERMMFCADKRIPVVYVPTIQLGASGPISLAGSLALANAECLAGLVMHQLRAPGSPFIYGGCVSPLDMKTTVFGYGSPEWRIADAVLSQLSQHYNLPIFGTAGATDSHRIDAQSGAEWAYSLLTCVLSGTNLIHDVGYRESGMTGSLDALVLCDEIIGMVRRVTAGFEISEETLGLEMINRIGPAGNFMAEDDTFERFRTDIWYPTLFNRDRFEHWHQAGEKDILQRAKERIDELLA